MGTYSALELIKVLNGPIKPVAETSEDDKRLKNLKNLASLIEDLIWEISEVATDYKSDFYLSRQIASKQAEQSLEDFQVIISNALKELEEK